MGIQIFNENSCSFPGVGDYLVAEVNEVAPSEPAALPPPPEEPLIPEAPVVPEDKYDQVKMVQYLNALSDYQNNVKAIQENFRNEMDLYQVMSDVYKGQMTNYMEELAHYTVSRASAVKGGEGIIKSVTEKYGWAWVNKDDPNIYNPWLIKTWVSQVEIMLVYFIIILVLIKKKDVK